MAQKNATMAPDGTQGGELTDSAMMKHLLDALENGQDIGHYGRLTFVMVAQWFMDDDEIISLLAKEPDTSEDDARALVAEVKAHKYVPPKPNTIERWQKMQDFPIVPESSTADDCNVYEHLRFPDEVYNEIGQYWEERAENESQ